MALPFVTAGFPQEQCLVLGCAFKHKQLLLNTFLDTNHSEHGCLMPSHVKRAERKHSSYIHNLYSDIAMLRINDIVCSSEQFKIREGHTFRSTSCEKVHGIELCSIIQKA